MRDCRWDSSRRFFFMFSRIGSSPSIVPYRSSQKREMAFWASIDDLLRPN